MKLELNDAQRAVQELARDFAAKEVAPVARELDRAATWPEALVRKLGELGLMGVAIPEDKGGTGADNVSYALAIEEVSAACASVGVIMSVNNSLFCDPLLKFGDAQQQESFLRPCAQGEKLGCFGLTEPASGSDAGTMLTTAVRDGDDWIINGSKNFITNGPMADFCLVFAMNDKSQRHHGITAFVVPRTTNGVQFLKKDDKLGIRAAHSCTVIFENCRVPDTMRLGPESAGFKVAMATLDGGRIGIAAQAVGIARAAYEKALAYSKERQAFGSAIAEKQAIRFMLAEMATEIEASRLLILRAATMKDQGLRHSRESAEAKLFASEMATRVTHKALQIHGGYGYTTEYDVERHYRDARITEIYEGTSEIMRIVIADAMLKE